MLPQFSQSKSDLFPAPKLDEDRTRSVENEVVSNDGSDFPIDQGSEEELYSFLVDARRAGRGTLELVS